MFNFTNITFLKQWTRVYWA